MLIFHKVFIMLYFSIQESYLHIKSRIFDNKKQGAMSALVSIVTNLSITQDTNFDNEAIQKVELSL